MFEFGSWNRDNNTFAEDSSITNVTLTIDSTNNTLTGLRDTINDSSMGVTASIIQTAESAYSLVVKSNSGSGNEMKITALTIRFILFPLISISIDCENYIISRDCFE